MQKLFKPEDLQETTARLSRRAERLEERLDRSNEELLSLRDRAQAYEHLFEDLPLGLMLLDAEGRPLQTNLMFKEYWGLEGGLNPKLPLMDQVPTFAEGDLGRALAKLLTSGTEFEQPFSAPGQMPERGATLTMTGRGSRVEDGRAREFTLILEARRFTRAQDQSGELASDQLKDMAYGSLEALSSLVERRDPFTAGHQRRVAQLATAIAEELAMDPFEVEGIRVAALLHEVGKVAIPAEILSKPASLTPAEKRIIETYPEVAQRILKRIQFPWPVAQAILEHQEREDGSGYPKGLPGNKILLQAKIIGVADIVEAMLTYRPYRPAHKLDAVLEELRRQRAHTLDARVVDACLNLLTEKQFVFDKR